VSHLSVSEVERRYVGKPCAWEVQGASVEVEVLRGRYGYGRVDLLVSPVSGEGAAWVRQSNLSLLRASFGDLAR